MLFTNGQKAKMAAGEMTLTFRGWTAPQAKAGGVYRFDDARDIAVTAVDLVPAASIDDAEAKLAGESSAAAMRAMLNKTSRREIGDSELVYRVAFQLVEARPKTESLPVDTIVAKLAAMDARSSAGPWTREYLAMIAANPRLGAKHHAARRGEETLELKAKVRRLKALGLTVSYEVGYGLTELGERVSERLREAPGS